MTPTQLSWIILAHESRNLNISPGYHVPILVSAKVGEFTLWKLASLAQQHTTAYTLRMAPSRSSSCPSFKTDKTLCPKTGQGRRPV